MAPAWSGVTLLDPGPWGPGLVPGPGLVSEFAGCKQLNWLLSEHRDKPVSGESYMSRPPRILIPHTVVMLTSRVQQGLPFVCTPLMDMIIWSSIASAQALHPIKIISFLMMGNHVHLIALVEEPRDIESFMERFKCETAHAVNRLLGRRQVTVWCEGYDSPAILTLEDLIEKVAYVYANPVRAHLAASISDYLGVSSWKIFTSGQGSKVAKRIRRNFLSRIPDGSLSAAEQAREALIVEQQAKEILTFNLSPDAWIIAFPNQMNPTEFNQRVLDRIKEIEQEMSALRERDQIPLPTEYEVITRPIRTPYSPKKFSRRMWCICRDVVLRIDFIKFVKQLRSEGREARLKWVRGDTAVRFPVGLFPPCQPMLANILPAFFRQFVATA